MQQVVVPAHPADESLTLSQVAEYRDQAGFHSGFWRTARGSRLLRWFLNSGFGKWLRRQFKGATAEELHGYAFWGPVALAIVVTEVLGAIRALRNVIPWPTISFTIGHLEDLRGLWGLAVVAVIATTAFYTFTYGATPPPSQGRTEFAAARGRFRLRYNWLLVLAVTALVALVVYLSTNGEREDLHRLHLAYAIYGTFAVSGIAIPLLLIWLKDKHVVFPTLFFSVNTLRRRFRIIGLLVLVGLSILFIHLALYPWPSLSRENANFASISGVRAVGKAEDRLADTPNAKNYLEYSTRLRRVLDGREAWYVYFLTHAPGQEPVYEKCFVVIQASEARAPSRGCLAS